MTVGSRSSISGDFDAGSVPHTIVVDDGVTRNGVYPPLSGSISLINVSVYASNCSALVKGVKRPVSLRNGASPCSFCHQWVCSRDPAAEVSYLMVSSLHRAQDLRQVQRHLAFLRRTQMQSRCGV